MTPPSVTLSRMTFDLRHTLFLVKKSLSSPVVTPGAIVTVMSPDAAWMKENNCIGIIAFKMEQRKIWMSAKGVILGLGWGVEKKKKKKVCDHVINLSDKKADLEISQSAPWFKFEINK